MCVLELCDVFMNFLETFVSELDAGAASIKVFAKLGILTCNWDYKRRYSLEFVLAGTVRSLMSLEQLEVKCVADEAWYDDDVEIYRNTPSGPSGPSGGFEVVAAGDAGSVVRIVRLVGDLPPSAVHLAAAVSNPVRFSAASADPRKWWVAAGVTSCYGGTTVRYIQMTARGNSNRRQPFNPIYGNLLVTSTYGQKRPKG
ncbi:hypothetical protein AXG93_394s1000 [Marchantia polymorpha subsp. ruderalis]|uniref:Uncharacterized protein n=1 Tax=Marchantia polymorpha subsp. ruderalis TaxID=1480154 RepID=A0A176VDY7_MARPO|nr:hypothetical protein AXG93_394s1000 [Marchantia polymorpha subsp. ruderalis]